MTRAARGAARTTGAVAAIGGAAAAAALVAGVAAQSIPVSPPPGEVQWVMQASGVTARLRGVSAVSDTVAWASGANGTILRTIDGGRTWTPTPIALPSSTAAQTGAAPANAGPGGAGETSAAPKDAAPKNAAQDGAPRVGTARVTSGRPEGGRAEGGQGGPSQNGSSPASAAPAGSTKGGAEPRNGRPAGPRFEAAAPVPAPALAAASPVADTASLDFRDIDALDADTAYVLSIGPGEASRIYKTEDGGATWELSFTNTEPQAFFDAMAFWDARRGVAVSDSVDGRFVIMLTSDGGRTWAPAPPSGLPEALDGEGAFAASGTNVAVYGTNHVWIGTGAAETARVLRSHDRGRTWAVADSPLPAGPSAGIFSIAFRDATHGIIVGGDYKKEGEAIDNVALTGDGGATWTLATGLSGFRSAIAYLPRGRTSPALLAVGPSGTDTSEDDGKRWKARGTDGFHAVSVARKGTSAWAVGEKGRIAKLDWPQ